ncbi:hypothetical protein [Listeria ilorinensis]|uniref:hypothetical protein n=1 Tax=Listeria ilorinensis TaxID=2867439 RepID=UPI001EF478CA|nr:hypothetical protein [Listeria ilorinensis]
MTFAKFNYNGRWSDEMGLLIATNQTFPLPERAVEADEVQGLNEKVIRDLGYWRNVQIEFPCVLIRQQKRTVKEQVHEVANWLLDNPTSYKKLVTPDDGDFYRLAAVLNAIEFTEDMETIGRGSIIFDAKPYRYSRMGNKPITITEKGKAFINRFQPSQPIIKLYAAGTLDLYINSQKMHFEGLTGYIELDCFMLTAKNSAGGNLSNLVKSYPFFVIEKGDNVVTWGGTGTVTKVEIIPRWQSL